MSHSHFTLGFPLRSGTDAAVLTATLEGLTPALFEAADTIGTIHYARFTLLSKATLLFLCDFDGEFSQLASDLAKFAGPVFDAIFASVEAPPVPPAAGHADAFAEWAADHLIHALNVYTAYPDATVK